MTNIELKILKTDQNSCNSVKNEISAQKQLDFNKKVGTVCDLGISTEKQLKIFSEKLKKLGTHCDPQNFTKCLQKSIKKWFFDLAWFVIRGKAQKMSNCTLFGHIWEIGEKLKFHRKALFDTFLAKCSIFNFSHDF